MNQMNKIVKEAVPYNRAQLIDKISRLNIRQNGLTVQTNYDETTLKESNVSDKYYTFDFPNFVADILPEAEKAFTPQNYSLRLLGGRQELNVIGEQLKINGETFYRMLSILNSTDKSRALQVNMGLMRLVCSNGMIVSVPGEVTSIKGKHFKASLPNKIEEFMSGISRFKAVTNQQKEIFGDLIGKKISFQELANALVLNKENIIIPSKIKKLKQLSGKLLNSETDRLQDITEEQRTVLVKPELIIYGDNQVDIEIDAYNALNCYTEIFRKTDSSKINRETNRIVGLLNTL